MSALYGQYHSTCHKCPSLSWPRQKSTASNSVQESMSKVEIQRIVCNMLPFVQVGFVRVMLSPSVLWVWESCFFGTEVLFSITLPALNLMFWTWDCPCGSDTTHRAKYLHFTAKQSIDICFSFTKTEETESREVCLKHSYSVHFAIVEIVVLPRGPSFVQVGCVGVESGPDTPWGVRELFPWL